MTQKTSISFFGKTDMGRIRTNNEDAFIAQLLWDENTYLVVVIDGVGGYEGGEIAAEIARKTITDFLLVSSNGERVELLKQAVTAANNAIFEARETDREHSQMSCVLTAAIIDVAQMQVSMAHVGDTRLYSFHHGELTKLSHDHSLVGFREEIGQLTEEEAMHHPQRNVIGRDVGSQKHKVNDDDFIEDHVFPLMPNTTLLLCSDGLTDMIPSAAISSILDGQKCLEEKTDSLIQAALDAGGKDNVTVVLFEYLDNESEVTSDTLMTQNDEEPLPPVADAPENESQSLSGCTRSRKKRLLFLFVGLLIGALATFFMMKCQLKDRQKQSQEQIRQLENEVQVLLNENVTLRDSLYNVE